MDIKLQRFATVVFSSLLGMFLVLGVSCTQNDSEHRIDEVKPKDTAGPTKPTSDTSLTPSANPSACVDGDVADYKLARPGGTQLSSDSANTTAPQVAVTRNGNAIVVWSQSCPPDQTYKHSIWANLYETGNGWTVPTRVSADAREASFPQVGTDERGNALVVWQQFDGPYMDIWANRYEAGKGWGTAARIDMDDAGHANSPQLAIDNAGNAIVVWNQFDGSYDNIYANRYEVGKGWSTPTLIDQHDGAASLPQVAVTENGHAIVVWQQYDESEISVWTDRSIWASRYSPDTGWTEATLLEGELGDAYFPRVAIDVHDNAVVSWAQKTGKIERVWARRYVASKGWQQVELFSDNTGEVLFLRVAVSDHANAMVLWYQRRSRHDYATAWFSEFDTEKGWADGAALESTMGLPSLAMYTNGDTIALWGQLSGKETHVWARRYVPHKGWRRSVQVPVDSRIPRPVRIAIAENGDIVAACNQQVYKGYSSIWALQYKVTDIPEKRAIEILNPSQTPSRNLRDTLRDTLRGASEIPSGTNRLGVDS